jgi:RNA polymerase sigma factor (sigma-70 family)
VPDPLRDDGDGRDLNPTLRLLDLAKKGDQRALSELFHRYHIPLTNWAHGRLCPAARSQNETRDVVQISFQKAFQSLDGFDYRHQGSFLGYLHQILRNEIATTNRRWIKKKPTVELDGEHVDPAPDPFDVTAERERQELYERALATMTSYEQELIRMREMGMRNSDIAEELDIASSNAARMAVSRAVARLAAIIAAMTHDRA